MSWQVFRLGVACHALLLTHSPLPFYSLTLHTSRAALKRQSDLVRVRVRVRARARVRARVGVGVRIRVGAGCWGYVFFL